MNTSMKTSTRNSGIELLRILCIVLIITGHYSFFGNSNIDQNSITIQQFYVQCIGSFGRVACGVFALISGYFLSQKSTTYSKHIIRIAPLILELQFYSMVILLLTWIFHLVPVTKTAALKAFFPLFWGNWYIVYYILIYLFSPFINRMTDTLNKRQYFLLVSLVVFIWGIVPLFSAHAWSFSAFDFFLACYLIGGYLFKFGNKDPDKKKCIIVIAVCVGLMFAAIAAIDAVGMRLGNETILKNYNYFGEYSSILAIPLEISLFYLFRGLNFQSAIVNRMASHVLGIYLIHENDFMRTWLWSDLFEKTKYINSWTIILHALISVVIVFAVCILIDWLRSITVGRLSRKWVRDHENQIENAVAGLFERAFSFVSRSSDN